MRSKSCTMWDIGIKAVMTAKRLDRAQKVGGDRVQNNRAVHMMTGFIEMDGFIRLHGVAMSQEISGTQHIYCLHAHQEGCV
jgi:hypothetical protein